MKKIWSIGHGTRSLADLLALLRENGIATLADVRSTPGSRAHPHFGKEALAVALSTAGLRYQQLEREWARCVMRTREAGGRDRPLPSRSF